MMFPHSSELRCETQHNSARSGEAYSAAIQHKQMSCVYDSHVAYQSGQ